MRPTLVLFQKECARALAAHFRKGAPPSGGTQPSGGMSAAHAAKAFHAIGELYDLAVRTEAHMVALEMTSTRLERRIEAIERHPRQLVDVESVRKAFDSDVRDNVRRRHPLKDRGAWTRSVNEFAKMRIGKRRERWLPRDYIVAIEVVEQEYGFRLSATRALTGHR